MIDGNDYYWKEWAGDAPHYMTVYPDPVFESFNVIYRNHGSNLENHLMVYVRNHRILSSVHSFRISEEAACFKTWPGMAQLVRPQIRPGFKFWLSLKFQDSHKFYLFKKFWP